MTYFIKTSTTWTLNGQQYQFYLESPLRGAGKYEPVTLKYKNAEFANVCKDQLRVFTVRGKPDYGLLDRVLIYFRMG